jgi:hypothetical protein
MSMSKFGWSYPAGCSGPPDTEGPDDALADAVYDMFDDATEDGVIDDMSGLTDAVFSSLEKN